MRRPVAGRTVFAILLLAGVAAAVATAVRSGGRPAIVLVTIDTLRADRVGAYGYGAAATPTLDSLAAEGGLFEDVLSSSPLTLPSHASILTGLHPPRHGMRDNDYPHPLAPRDGRPFRTAAEILLDAGYQTAAFVSGSPLAPRWGLDAGFDRYDAPEEGEPGRIGLDERDGSATMGKVLGYLGARDRSRPLFLWVHLFDPHEPYAAPGGRGHPVDSPEAYDEEVAHADAQLGRLVDHLRREGTLDRTVLVVAADHGEGLGDHGEQTHGFFLHRSTLRVPWIVRYPSRVRAGTRVAAPAALVDLLPTLLDLAGLPPAETPLDGVSRAGPLGGRSSAPPPTPAEVPEQYAETLAGWRTFRWAQSVAARSGDRHLVDHGGGRTEASPSVGAPLAAPSPEPTPADAAVVERAWGVFTSRPLATGGEGADPGLGSVGYVSAYGPVTVLPSAENGALRLPSAPFLTRFLAAVRLVDRSRGAGDPETAVRFLRQAREILDLLDREDPGNPALPFWRGRAWALEARLVSGGGGGTGSATAKWSDAFAQYLEAGRRGYRNSRTLSLMLQAAFLADRREEMLRVAERATSGPSPVDGDSAYWAWIALAHVQGGVEDGLLPPDHRAAAEAALKKATARARSTEERKWIEEVRSQFK